MSGCYRFNVRMPPELPSGYSGIRNPNGLNLLIQIKLFFKRGLKLHKKVFDPENSREIAYGNENISYQRFLPSFTQRDKYFEILKQIEDFIRKIPILKNFAVGCTVVALKRSEVAKDDNVT